MQTVYCVKKSDSGMGCGGRVKILIVKVLEFLCLYFLLLVYTLLLYFMC